MDARAIQNDDVGTEVRVNFGIYKWVVLALTCGLMMSDYATRAVITGVFPLLKSEWKLTDIQLGALVSIVPLVVGIGAFPIAFLADRWGRVKSITAMAAVWCVSTVACGVSQNYSQMMAARGFVGVGEAGYGGAGGAILANVFPQKQRALAFGILLAASLVGTVAGVLLGGFIGQRHGWRSAFIVVGAASLILVVLYPLVVKDYKTIPLTKQAPGAAGRAKGMGVLDVLRELFSVRTATITWIAGGLSNISLGAFMAWIPAYVGRSYSLGAEHSALLSSVALGIVGLSMIFGGAIADRIGAVHGERRLYVLAAYVFMQFVFLTTAFLLPAGNLQLVLVVLGALFVGAHGGVLIAVTTDVVHPGLCATGIAIMVLANNLIGLAPGPVIAGALSDIYGLQTAMAITPLAGLAAAALYLVASKSYRRDRGRLDTMQRDSF